MQQSGHIDLSKWYTVDQAEQRLAENAGRPICNHYARTLVRDGKVRTLDLGARAKLYSREDIDDMFSRDIVGSSSIQPRDQKAGSLLHGHRSDIQQFDHSITTSITYCPSNFPSSS